MSNEICSRSNESERDPDNSTVGFYYMTDTSLAGHPIVGHLPQVSTKSKCPGKCKSDCNRIYPGADCGYCRGKHKVGCCASSLDSGCEICNWCRMRTWNTINKEACCAGTKDTVQDCHPYWCVKNQACDGTAAARNYCSTGDNISSDICLDRCKRLNNPAWCGAAITSFCNRPENKLHALCTCLNSPIPIPECYDPKCSGSAVAYMTPVMIENRQQGCGSTTLCQAIFNFVTEGGSLGVEESTLVTQNCGAIPSDGGSGGGGGGQGDGGQGNGGGGSGGGQGNKGDKGDKGNSDSDIPDWVYYAGGAVAAVLVLLLLFGVGMRRKRQPEKIL